MKSANINKVFLTYLQYFVTKISFPSVLFVFLPATSELQIHAHVADDDVRDHWRTDVNISAREAVVTYFTAFGGEHVLFRDGMETDEGFDIFGNRITLQKSTLQKSTFSISKAQPSDAGRYEIHDKNGHLAISLYLERDPGQSYAMTCFYCCIMYLLIRL